MKDVITGVAQQSSEEQRRTPTSSENNEIQQYYGQIGLPAVAAAVRYQGDSRNMAYARVAIHVC